MRGTTIRTRLAAAVATAATLGLAAPVPAAPIVFQGLDNANLSGGGAHPVSDAAAAAFAAAAGGVAVQDFDAVALGALPATVAVGDLTATLTPGPDAEVRAGVGPFDTFPVSGARYIESLARPGEAFLGVAFSAPVTGFGFHLTDPNDWLGYGPGIAHLVVRLVRAGGTTDVNLFDSVDPATIVSGGIGFFGIVDAADPFLGFSILHPAGNPDADAIGIDNLAIAAVPLPATGLLVLTALGGLAATGRRRA